jgi:hypothetical protein
MTSRVPLELTLKISDLARFYEFVVFMGIVFMVLSLFRLFTSFVRQAIH